MTKFFKIVLLFFFLATYLRLFDLSFSHMYEDVGYELEAARMINKKKELPLVGPAIGIKDLFIPPTYLYLVSFFYLISGGNFDVISIIYSLMGVLSILFLFILTYMLSGKNRCLSLIVLAAMVFWNYHVHLSRGVWHPYPVFFFSSLSMLLGALAVRKRKLLLLFASQYAFFIALSIYPSPVFIFPIIWVMTYYLFGVFTTKIWNRIFLSVLSIVVFGALVYLPQIVFEVVNHWPSINTIIEHWFKPDNSNIYEFIQHFWRFFETFFSLFFSTDSLIGKIFFLIFTLFLLITGFILRRKDSVEFLPNVFNSLFLIIWILVVSCLLNDLDHPYVRHRVDIIAIVFWLILVIRVKQILSCADFIRRTVLLLPVAVFLIFFFVWNVPRTWREPIDGDQYSYYVNKKISDVVVTMVRRHGLPREEVMTYYDFGVIKNYDSAYAHLWTMKWHAEPIDHLVNQKFPEAVFVTSDFHRTFNFNNRDISYYLNPTYYILICNNYQYNQNCLTSFKHSLTELSDHDHDLRKMDTMNIQGTHQDIQILLLVNNIL